MKLNELTESSVIDGNDKFKQRRADANRERIKKVVGEVPGMFAKQEELEKWFNGKLDAIDQIPNRELFHDRKQLSTVLKHYQHKTNLLKALLWTAEDVDDPSEEAQKVARGYITKNLDKILKILEKMQNELKKLCDEADKKEWPAPWRRYTRYPYFAHEQNHLEKDYKHIKTIGKFKE